MIPRLFKHRNVVVIASGPSLTKEDVDYCKNKATIFVVNDNYRLAPWADLLYAADYPWWVEHEGVPDFKGLKYTQDQRAAAAYGITHVDGRWRPGISHSREYIHYGYNSGFQAFNLAYLMGAKNIYLLGFDFMMDGDKKHWFGDHPGNLNKDMHEALLKMRRHMDSSARQCRNSALNVVNCSRRTALKEFDRGIITDCI